MNVRRATSILLGLLVISAAFAVTEAGAALRLDPGFGKHGLVRVPGRSGADGYGYSPEVVAEEPRGGLIFVDGEGALHRIDPTGEVDLGFGDDGAVKLPAPAGGAFQFAAAAVDAKGRLLVVGTATPEQPEPKELPIDLNGFEASESKHSDIRLLRYLPNGSLDASFGKGGIVDTDLGLRTPESGGVRLSAAPVVEATGIAIDGSGRVVVTGGAGTGLTAGGCFHDDYFPSLVYAGLVARFTESGGLDRSFGVDGVFGARSKYRIPLRMEDTEQPVIAPDESVILQRGPGHCPTGAGSLGFFSLTRAGRVRTSRGVHALHGRVLDAAAAPNGSTVLLLGPQKGSEASTRIVELRPDGSPDRRFSKDGSATLSLPNPRWSGVDSVEVAPDGEVLAQATIAPPPRKREGEEHWWARFSVGLLGLTPQGNRDPRVGPGGLVVKHIPHWWDVGGLWLDPQGRPTVSIGYRPKNGPLGLAAIRFEPLG